MANNLMNWEPFREAVTLSDAMNRLMREAYVQPGNTFAHVAPMNVVEQAHQYLIQVALPGVNPDDVDITCERTSLTVKAHRDVPWNFESQSDQEKPSFLLNEFGEGTFTRTVTFPKPFTADAIEATFDRGILTIVAPIAQEAQPKKIKVTEGIPMKHLVGANGNR